eukprot:12292.XXX_531082_531375_1 [CDS] Oithona nana genome sequencing.
MKRSVRSYVSISIFIQHQSKHVFGKDFHLCDVSGIVHIANHLHPIFKVVKIKLRITRTTIWTTLFGCFYIRSVNDVELRFVPELLSNGIVDVISPNL